MGVPAIRSPAALGVPADRLLRILARLSAGGDAQASGPRRLCEVAAEVTAMSGAGIMLLAGDQTQGSLCTTNPVSALIEELQFTLGEGPCVDAHTRGTMIAEPNLDAPADLRWPAFAPPALNAGARAVFGFPIRVGSARLGALDLYRDRPGPLSDDQHADALVMADVAARAILTMQAGAPPGAVAAELETEANLYAVVHNAAGMVSVQLAVSVGEALVRLRAHAFRTGQLITHVAQDVVNQRLRFDTAGSDCPEWP